MAIARLSGGALLLAMILAPSWPTAADDQPSAAQLMDDLMWNRGPIGGPFALTDHRGKLRNDSEFRGKLLVIYFGYTYCPDICPTDLMAISQAIVALGAAGEMIQPLFITIDPERDTKARLAEYVPVFHRRLIGLTGSPEEIRLVARSFKAYYAKNQIGRGDDYTIDHTGVIYFVGRNGQYLGFTPPRRHPSS